MARIRREERPATQLAAATKARTVTNVMAAPYIIHVHQQRLRRGEPAIIVRYGRSGTGKNHHGYHEAVVLPAGGTLAQADKPLSCGARAWIEAPAWAPATSAATTPARAGEHAPGAVTVDAPALRAGENGIETGGSRHRGVVLDADATVTQHDTSVQVHGRVLSCLCTGPCARTSHNQAAH